MLMTEADRRTEQLRYAMTPAEVIGAQLWLWRREASLRKPRGDRRRRDAEAVCAPMAVWRTRKGWTRTDLARAITRAGASTLVSLDTVRRLETGTAAARTWAVYLPRIVEALGIPMAALLVPRKASETSA